MGLGQGMDRTKKAIVAFFMACVCVITSPTNATETEKFGIAYLEALGGKYAMLSFNAPGAPSASR